MWNLDPERTRDAARLALQSAVAAVVTFVSLHALGSEETFVGVISAVLIVQPSVGSTVSAGRDRLIATLVGSAIGVGCLFALPAGYGAAVALAITMLVMNFVAGFRPDWRYGVVAAVALALADSDGNLDLARDRSIAIGLGILVGIVASLIIWPDSAAARASRYRIKALLAVARKYALTFSTDPDAQDKSQVRQEFHHALTEGRNAVARSSETDEKSNRVAFELIEELYNSIIVVDRFDDPMEAFDDSNHARSEIREAGQNAICALIDEDLDFEPALEAFSDAIDALEQKPSADFGTTEEGQVGASALLALKEVARSLRHMFDEVHEHDEMHALDNVRSAVKELKPQ